MDAPVGGVTASAEWLSIRGSIPVWRSLGLVVDPDGVIPLVGTSLRIESCEGAVEESLGLVGWALSGDVADGADSIDGLATDVVDARSPRFANHELGAIGLDHVVVLTNDLERTSDAISAATGCELKRVREVGTMRQGFHRLGRGGLIVELVERPDIEPGPATFWGVVLNVEDIDDAFARLGEDRLSPPKDAVQPGRRIATVRADVGLGLPVALMTPDR